MAALLTGAGSEVSDRLQPLPAPRRGHPWPELICISAARSDARRREMLWRPGDQDTRPDLLSGQKWMAGAGCPPSGRGALHPQAGAG